MPTANCPTCNTDHDWSWEDAFDKFGFGDGDGLVMTHVVVEALAQAGYVARSQMWGMHNTIITSITKDGTELIPQTFDYRDGNPHTDLPEALVAFLDEDADYDAAADALARREELNP